MRELDALQKQQNRKNFACHGAGKLTGLGVLLGTPNNMRLCYSRGGIDRKYDDNCQRTGKLTGLGVLLMT